MKRSFVMMIVVVMLFAACNSTSAPATPTRAPLLSTPASGSKPTLPPIGLKPTRPAPTESGLQPEPTTPPIEPSGNTSAMLFHDNFDDANSGWDVYDNDNGSVGYDNGEYVIKVKPDTFWLWGNPYQAVDDVSVEVDAALASGAEDSDMGVICRYQADNKNFMFAIITADGRYGIYEVKEGTDTLLTGDALRSSSAIKTGKVSNHIQFVCKGNEFTLNVNGQSIDSVTNTAFASGDVGLIAGTGDTGNNEVRYDNFVVTPAATGTRPPDHAVLGGSTLFEDDFSDPNSGWDVGQTDNGSTAYGQGDFVIKVKTPSYSKWSIAHQTLDSVSIEVDAQLAGGPEISEYGLICRYQGDDKNMIFATISGDGYYGIYEEKDGDESLLTGGGKLQPADAVKTGRATNHLQFICSGNTYTLLINDQQVDSITNNRLSGGDIGLYAANGSEGGVEVHFDNLVATVP
jgi:hypothetical protein